MARLCKLNGLIFAGLVTFFHPTFCGSRTIEAVKILNKSEAELLCSHAIPKNVIVYVHFVSTEFPRAHITNWYQATHGNCPWARKQDRIKPLPVYVRIGFDREVSQIFVDDFFATFKASHSMFRGIHPVRHRKFRKEFIFRVGPHYTFAEIETFIEKANISMFKKKSSEISAGVRKYA